MRAGPLLERLRRSVEPSLRWKAEVFVLGASPDSRRSTRLRDEVRDAPRTRAILGGRGSLGRSGTLRGVYYKWQGAHWALARLADLGYPAGDPQLERLRDRVLDTWLHPRYFDEYDTDSLHGGYGHTGVPRMRGRYRRCASQQGNALDAIVRLGLDDGRGARLAERLRHWQWPDGGWNCDRHPEADTSSFMETLLPMVGLDAYGAVHRRSRDRAAARRASEVFLRRKLYRRISDDRVIRNDFTRLHYPAYYHYDVLAGLEAMVRLGRIRDPRCSDALDLLESKRLPDGGWPAEAKYYRFTPRAYVAGGEYVDWGGTSRSRSNPWVSVNALAVLRAAGRLSL